MVFDDKKAREIQRMVPKLINEGVIDRDEKYKKLCAFYIEQAIDSLNSADVLYKISTDEDLKIATGFPYLKAFLWTINASYYSMFYIISALLASQDIKVKSNVGIHKLTFNAFLYYFYLNKKISKKYVEEFLEEQQNSEELLGREEIDLIAEQKARKLISDLDNEQNKRKFFTYETERTKIETKAKTSLERAKLFVSEVREMIAAR